MNARNENGDAPIHTFVRGKNRYKFDCLMALLVYSDTRALEIDAPSADDNTALHLAVQVSSWPSSTR